MSAICRAFLLNPTSESRLVVDVENWDVGGGRFVDVDERPVVGDRLVRVAPQLVVSHQRTKSAEEQLPSQHFLLRNHGTRVHRVSVAVADSVVQVRVDPVDGSFAGHDAFGPCNGAPSKFLIINHHSTYSNRH